MAGKRARHRADMEQQILEAGRSQLREVGAAALSLRAIARELGVASSAVYRYVENRDELLTLLIVDAFTDLADAVDVALDAADPEPRQRLASLGGAMRRWALENREQWTLLYGSPVPGYSAPADRTGGPGVRVMRRLLEIAADGTGISAGTRSGLSPARLHPATTRFLADAREELGVSADEGQVAAAAMAWGLLAGMVSAEVFGQWGPVEEGAIDGLAEIVVNQAAEILGLPGSAVV